MLLRDEVEVAGLDVTQLNQRMHVAVNLIILVTIRLEAVFDGLKVCILTVDELGNSCELRVIHQLLNRLELRLDQVSCRWFYHRVVESELANVGQERIFEVIQVFLSSRCESDDPVACSNFLAELGHSVEHHVVELVNDSDLISHADLNQTL